MVLVKLYANMQGQLSKFFNSECVIFSTDCKSLLPGNLGVLSEEV